MKFKHIITFLLFSLTLSGCQISKSYTVTWENYDGTLLEVDNNVVYGTMPTYDGATPSKDGTDQYTYTFSGWSPSVVAVTSDATYIAQFSSAINSYTITWENYDGTVLEVDNVAYGTMPTYDGATPSKGGSAQYTYTFSGWSPSVVAVTSDATYIAQFSSAINSYTITWENYDGTVLEVDNNVVYGTMPTYDGGTPTREDDEEGSYLFSGWSPSVTFVTSNQTYTAQYVNGFLEFSLNSDEISYSVRLRSEVTPISIEIPSTYLGKPVTSIGNSAFSGCSSLTSIVIPDSVTSIRNNAFSSCTSLTSIVIPDSVTTIGDYAFYYCTSLTSIVIPDSVTSIGNSAFSSCTSLTSIVIPDSVTSIGTWAFYYCTSLTSIVIPDSVTTIGDYAFYYCTSLTSIVIPDSVTSIGTWEFYYCTSLTSIVIPNSVTSIGNSAFSGCSSLTSIVIPDSVTSIGNSAFSSCTSLTSIVIPNSVTSIGTWAFSGCTSLTSIVIPDSVTSIDDRAFSSCSSLTSIVIPDSVTTIGDYAFYNCTSLTSIVIPDGVNSIGKWAFFSCTSLTSIVIPDGVTSIGYSAFAGCKSLTIYVEASSKPSGWNSNWNSSNRPVVWGYVG